MNSKKFFDWCRTAVSSIKHWPQRDKIHKELYDHLEDRYVAFRDEGCDHEDSEDKTIAIMGDPQEVAAQLAKTYKPFWPKLLVATRCGIAASLVFAVAVVLLFVRYDDILQITQIDMIQGGIATFSLSPNVTQYSHGYTMTVKRVAYEPFMRERDGEETICTQKNLLLLDMEVTHPQIWLCPPEELEFWAVDSAGDLYENVDVYSWWNSEGTVHTGLFEYTHQLSIYSIDARKLDWIELHCEAEGRELIWRIDLPGGGT